MPKPAPPVPPPAVLIVVRDDGVRSGLERACRVAGIQVLAVSRIAEVERWPKGEVVIGDALAMTPWWKAIGALRVIGIADGEDEGAALIASGASGWMRAQDSDLAIDLVTLAAKLGPTVDYRDLGLS